MAEEDFVVAQYQNDEEDLSLQDPYGYYNENGEYVYYDHQSSEVPVNELEAHTDQGIIFYQEIEVNGQILLVDREGRLLNPEKLQGEDPNQYEDYEIFVSAWQPQRISSVMDAINTSMCVWPLISPPVYLKRLDIFENTSKLSHFGTTTVTESRKIRYSGDFIPVMSLMVLSNPTQLTHQLYLEKVTPPLRTRFRTTGGKNRRDVTRWYLAETLDAFVGTAGSPGTIDYFVDWTDGPDRYLLSASFDPRPGWRRLWRFSAYPVTQYYILHREVDHPLLESEGGKGRTCNIVKGTQVFCRKRWKLIGSFFAFDLPLPASNKYTLFTCDHPFHRMKLTLENKITAPSDEVWTEQFSFYAFDIPVPGTCKYDLQHCVRSIHTTSASVTRHRLTNEDPRLPWQFNMTIYVFPAALEDCTVTYECDHFL